MSPTKKYRTGYIITSILSVLCLFGPMIYFFIAGWNVTNSTGKYALCSVALMCVIITVLNLIFKYHFRSALYIILIALTIIFNNALDMIILFSCLQICDELVISPLQRHYKERYTINREIDKRLS